MWLKKVWLKHPKHKEGNIFSYRKQRGSHTGSTQTDLHQDILQFKWQSLERRAIKTGKE